MRQDPLEGLFHSLQAISKKGAKVLEFEKPANKNDLIRFSDDYGREKKNYEGKRFTKKINLNSVKLKVPKKKNKSLNFKYKNINLNLSFKRNFSKIQKNDKSTCAILDGKIIDEKNRTVIDYGEVIKTNTLKILAKKFFIKKPILVLHISKIKKN